MDAHQYPPAYLCSNCVLHAWLVYLSVHVPIVAHDHNHIMVAMQETCHTLVVFDRGKSLKISYATIIMVHFMSKGNTVSFNHRHPVIHDCSAILFSLCVD